MEFYLIDDAWKDAASDAAPDAGPRTGITEETPPEHKSVVVERALYDVFKEKSLLYIISAYIRHAFSAFSAYTLTLTLWSTVLSALAVLAAAMMMYRMLRKT